MNKSVLQFYPLPNLERPLKGLYLEHNLRQLPKERLREGLEETFVYANFITSLDGRICHSHPSRPGFVVPKNTANDRDWRLFQELATQADIIISSGRYLRDWADGRAQEILRVDDPEFADLKQWRLERGLSPQPDIAVISGSLRFPIPDVLKADGRQVVVFTTANPDPDRVAEIEAGAARVIVAGQDGVDGAQMVARMIDLGYKTIYSAAGPKILHLLLAGGVLNRLYLTYANRLLGGNPFSSIVEGDLFDPVVNATLNSIDFDSQGVDGLGQLFISFDLGF